MGWFRYQRRVRTSGSQAQLCGRLALTWSKMEEPRRGQVVKLPMRSLSAEAEAKLAL